MERTGTSRGLRTGAPAGWPPGRKRPRGSIRRRRFFRHLRKPVQGRGHHGNSRGFAVQGEDLETEVHLALAEVFTGVTKRVTLHRRCRAPSATEAEPFVDAPVQPARGRAPHCNPIRSKSESPPESRMERGYAWQARDKRAPTAASPATYICVSRSLRTASFADKGATFMCPSRSFRGKRPWEPM